MAQGDEIAYGLPGAGLNAPEPLPSITLTVLPALSAVAKSGMPSPLKSPVARENGCAPTLTRLAETGAKPPNPLPVRMAIVPLTWLATARS